MDVTYETPYSGHESISAFGTYSNSTFMDYLRKNETAAFPAGVDRDEDDTLARVKLLKRIFYTYLSPIVIFIGIVGDALCVAVLSHKFLRRAKVIYTYLRALACTDLATHLSTMPMVLWIVDIKSCHPWLAFYYAHIGFPLANAFMATSVWIVVFITLGQYVAVCHPFLQTFRSRRMCMTLTVVAYVISFSIYLPWAWRKTVVSTQSPDPTVCQHVALDNPQVISSIWFVVYQWTREIISRFLPFLLILYFNVRILCVYKQSKVDRMKVVGGESQKRLLRTKSDIEEKRLWFLLLTIMLVFFVCTLPAAPLTIFVRDSREQQLTFQLFRAVGNVLEFTKFALNFYFYCMINRDIRRLFMYKLRLFIRLFNKNVNLGGVDYHQHSAHPACARTITPRAVWAAEDTSRLVPMATALTTRRQRLAPTYNYDASGVQRSRQRRHDEFWSHAPMDRSTFDTTETSKTSRTLSSSLTGTYASRSMSAIATRPQSTTLAPPSSELHYRPADDDNDDATSPLMMPGKNATPLQEQVGAPVRKSYGCLTILERPLDLIREAEV